MVNVPDLVCLISLHIDHESEWTIVWVLSFAVPNSGCFTPTIRNLTVFQPWFAQPIPSTGLVRHICPYVCHGLEVCLTCPNKPKYHILLLLCPNTPHHIPYSISISYSFLPLYPQYPHLARFSSHIQIQYALAKSLCSIVRTRCFAGYTSVVGLNTTMFCLWKLRCSSSFMGKTRVFGFPQQLWPAVVINVVKTAICLY